MIDVNELRKGVTFEQDGDLYKVMEYSHKQTRPRLSHYPDQSP